MKQNAMPCVSLFLCVLLPDEFGSMPDDDMIVCRCEEITKGEIRRAVHEGFRSLTEINRVLRNGMGLCQGQIEAFRYNRFGAHK